MSKPEVFVSKTYFARQNPNHDTAFAKPAREMMHALNIDTEGRTVMLKPNITAGAPRNSGIVTHPAFISGLIDYFVEEADIPPGELYVAEMKQKEDFLRTDLPPLVFGRSATREGGLNQTND